MKENFSDRELDDLLDQKIKETESRTREQYGPSREEQIEEERKRREKLEREAREREAKQREEERRKFREEVEREKEEILAKIREHGSILSVDKIVDHGDSFEIHVYEHIGSGSNGYTTHKGEDLAASMRFCELNISITMSSDRTVSHKRFVADMGTGLRGGTVQLSGGYYENHIGRGMKGGKIIVPDTPHAHPPGYIGQDMQGGEIHVIPRVVYANTVGENMRVGLIRFYRDVTRPRVGENMSGGQIIFSGNLTTDMGPGHLGKNMSGGQISIARSVSDYHIGENMSGGEIIVDGSFLCSSFNSISNLSIGKSMSGGRIIIKGPVCDPVWDTPLPLSVVGRGMTRGTIVLEQYLYEYKKGGMFSKPQMAYKRLVIQKPQ